MRPFLVFAYNNKVHSPRGIANIIGAHEEREEAETHFDDAKDRYECVEIIDIQGIGHEDAFSHIHATGDDSPIQELIAVAENEAYEEGHADGLEVNPYADQCKGTIGDMRHVLTRSELAGTGEGAVIELSQQQLRDWVRKLEGLE